MVSDGRSNLSDRAGRPSAKGHGEGPNQARCHRTATAWGGVNQVVTISKGGRVVRLTINSREALVNGEVVTLDVPAAIVAGYTVVPLRFISEALGATVTWLPESEMIVITDQPLIE